MLPTYYSDQVISVNNYYIAINRRSSTAKIGGGGGDVGTNAEYNSSTATFNSLVNRWFLEMGREAAVYLFYKTTTTNLRGAL